MSNFKEVVKESIEKGIILDSCGQIERFYDYGRYIDLCGLDPKDIVENMQNAGTGGGGSSKTNVVINGVVKEENGEYYVEFNATSVVLDIITISMIIDGKTQTVTMQPGSVEAKFGPVEKYCEITNVTVTPQSTSVAKYSANVVNPNGKGIFNVSVIKVINNEETLISTKEYKYKDIVKITASDIEGYDFINWDNGIESGDTINIEFEMPEHDVEIKCYYNIKTFTITWLDDDNTELASTTVNYGDTPEYPNDNPSKVSTEKYNYTFKGWTPSITEAKEDKTYTAEYTSEIRKYEIVFVNEDGTELLRTDVEYDTMPSYNGTTPTKESTQQYDYTFSGWDPEIKEVTGDATYTAQYTSQIRQYNITWLNDDNTVLTSTTVNYGDTPEYPNGTPTKESTEKYDYTFTGWDKELSPVTGEETYTAQFTNTIRKYSLNVEVTNGTYMIEEPTPVVGEFSVSDTEKVVFSQGNLQYNTEDKTWKFADEQYSIVDQDNINIGNPDFKGTVDMFGWSNGNENKFGAIPSNLNEKYEGEFVDWGTLFKGNEEWFTLSKEQWEYLLNTRPNASKLQEIAQVAGINGIMLLPDNWERPENCEPTTIEVEGANVLQYTNEQWSILEESGVVFLPSAGRRTGGYGNLINKQQEVETNPENLNEEGYYAYQDNTNFWGYYWTSTIDEENKNVSYAINIKSIGSGEFTIGPMVIWSEIGRYGQSVRLVKLSNNDTNMYYEYDQDVKIKATSINEHYTVDGKDGSNTSIEETITIKGNTNKTYVFKINEYDIVFKYGKNNEDSETLTLEYGTKVKEESDKILPPYYETPESGYTFSGWNPEITEETIVEGTAIYTAQYTSQTRGYVVKWFNYDGTSLETDENVPYGTLPSYDGVDPIRTGEHYTYVFKGWIPEVISINGDASYTAYFEEIPKEYTLNINVINGDCSVNPEKETYIYNDKVTIVITPEEGYEYSPLENIITITGDTTLNYTCEAKKYTLTVDGKVYENIPYNSDITPYLTYQPQEGMSHKWMEGDNVFDGKTMPNRNLTLTSAYEEFTESKMVYYGTDLLKNIENFTIEDVLNKNKQEYNGTEQEFIFNYSGASEDIVLEYEETFDEALEEMCQQYYYIAIPSNKTVTIINAAKQEITQYFTIKNEQLIIDNTNYDQYTYRMTGVNIYPETIKLKIIIK